MRIRFKMYSFVTITSRINIQLLQFNFKERLFYVAGMHSYIIYSHIRIFAMMRKDYSKMMWCEHINLYTYRSYKSEVSGIYCDISYGFSTLLEKYLLNNITLLDVFYTNYCIIFLYLNNFFLKTFKFKILTQS